MLRIRPGDQRGHVDHGWLDSWHTFSFSDYYDPAHMGFSVLRVINEDVVAPGKGFPTHGHRDMEILTWILEGALEHKDRLGNGDAHGRASVAGAPSGEANTARRMPGATSVIRPGEAQRMSAGTGIRHSEYNPSPTEPVHLLQIWLLPDTPGVTPGYEQKRFDDAQLSNRLCLIASPDGRDGSVTIHQDARVYAARLHVDGDVQGRTSPGARGSAGAPRGAEVKHALAPGRRAWVQVARGAAALNGQQLAAGDGAALEHETTVTLAASESAEVLLFDLP